MTSRQLPRRSVLLGSLGVLAAGSVASCGGSGPGPAGTRLIGPHSEEVRAAERLRRARGQRVVAHRITAQPTTVDLGGRTVETWAYGDSVPGPVLRTTAGDLLRVELTNSLPDETSIHWHGLALSNDMDGVPGITQDPIRAGDGFTYELTTPDPGTYFFHPHSGVQLDRGLYGVLVVDDRAEPGGYDQEWVVVLDDWVDGTGRTPDDVLVGLVSMSGMGHGGAMGEGMFSSLLGGAGDVDYPQYLVNGRTPAAPATLSGKPGERARIRIINAGSDTAFRLALGGHRLTVTHSDGFPVRPVTTDALLIGMGERYDVTVDLADGVFPLVAAAEGKAGVGMALVRTAAGAAPEPEVRIRELGRQVLLGTDLAASSGVGLVRRSVDRQFDVVLGGTIMPYRWTINGASFPDTRALDVASGERVRLRIRNQSMMFHPVHLHGHTFGLVEGGARKDTVIVKPMQSLEVDLDSDNPGQWALHCHNIYHAETGMMTVLSYRS
ncbi:MULTISPECIES: multicopper oxidase family protein [Nocardioides]|uniref:Multicopper oxidase family protein n=1 Tax=Nocardioides vastitatis TaxID=2568655 RepID=A0ABW0ZNJ7_9ACTN|nr:multicopper oxidase family protein [Nocardioides sp.]THJ06200.1 multicopper oxidase family protein [Nocardioides sp.]